MALGALPWSLAWEAAPKGQAEMKCRNVETVDVVEVHNVIEAIYRPWKADDHAESNRRIVCGLYDAGLSPGRALKE